MPPAAWRGSPLAAARVSGLSLTERKVQAMAELARPTSARPAALVTGASSGIGAALAREAANDGYDLVLVARRRAPMEALAAELRTAGADSTIIEADLSQAGAAANLMRELETRGIAVDLLINNAGLGDSGRFDQSDPQKIAAMLQVNIVALTELTRLVLPAMMANQRGKIMLLASTAAFTPGPKMAVYYASKAYVLSFGRALAFELRGSGVTVTTLCPGATATEFAHGAQMEGSALFTSPTVMQAAERRAHRLSGAHGRPPRGHHRAVQQADGRLRALFSVIHAATHRQLAKRII